jgi:hypothetical protein
MPTQSRPANNLIVATKDHLVIFDEPSGELQSRWGHRRGQEEISGQDLNLATAVDWKFLSVVRRVRRFKSKTSLES